MYKKMFGILIAVPLVLNGIAVRAETAYDSDSENLLPTDFSDYNVIQITAEALENCVTEMPEKDLLMSVQSDEEPSLPSFYSYGTDYGYKYLGTLENGGAMQICYDELAKYSENFAGSTEDISAVTTYGSEIYPLAQGPIPDYPGLVPFEGMSADDAVHVYFMFRQDHPEYYWLSTTIMSTELEMINPDSGEVVSTLAALVPVIDKDYAQFSVRSGLDTVMGKNFNDMLERAKAMPDRYTAIKQIHDDICDATDYGWVDTDKTIALDEPAAHNIQGVLDGDGEADSVCESYSKTMQLLMNALEIPNVLVIGRANDGNHAWNAAMLDDGNYYYFDTTWDDGNDGDKSEKFFARGSSEFAGVITFADGEFYYDGNTEQVKSKHYPYSKALADAVAADSPGHNDPAYFQYDLPEIAADDYVYTPIADEYITTQINDNGDGSYTISFDGEIPAGCSLYTAQYDKDGALIEVKITNDEVTFDPDSRTAEIKAFVLNGSLKPYADMARVEVRSESE